MKHLTVLAIFGFSVLTVACGPSTNQVSAPGADAPKVFALSACPVLEGHYTSPTGSKTITETREKDDYKIILGEGASELLIDGNTHAAEQGATYQGSCTDGMLEVAISQNGQRVVLLQYSLDSKNNLIEDETVGGAVASTTWVKAE